MVEGFIIRELHRRLATTTLFLCIRHLYISFQVSQSTERLSGTFQY
jgi:hypothetical protein